MTHPREIVTTGMAERHDGPIDRIPPYDPDRREHLWITTAVYRVDAAKIEARESLIMDNSNLLLAGQVGCYHCERGYEKRLTFRPCPGDPDE